MTRPTKLDIVKLLSGVRDGGWLWSPETGKLTRSYPVALDDELPWITSNLDFDCFMWNRIFHHGAAQNKMVHTHCQNCFKIVVSPRTFAELLALEEYQASCGMRCKCGIETRQYVGRPYGGYFYSWEPGELIQMGYRDDPDHELTPCMVIDDSAALQQGRLKYERVRDELSCITTEPGEMPIILKRGCTEFEANCGPTDQPRYRNISEEQLALEAAIDEHVDFKKDDFVAAQPDHIKDAIRMRWAEWAHFIGDMSYVQWLGRSISVPPVTYHEDE